MLLETWMASQESRHSHDPGLPPSLLKGSELHFCTDEIPRSDLATKPTEFRFVIPSFAAWQRWDFDFRMRFTHNIIGRHI